ncbi:Ig-like domain-containing protein [Agarivorans sp. QJM3NY_29]|uniref:Ig-like domain-containing protein n=1 Tax=unclassified Agarivorans TaxID=2636026 RepID=UPI003D7DC225
MKRNKKMIDLTSAFAGLLITVSVSAFGADSWETSSSSDREPSITTRSIEEAKHHLSPLVGEDQHIFQSVPFDRLVIIDADVPHSAVLQRAFGMDMDMDNQIIQLSALDTLATLSEKLASFVDLDAIHLISHGAPGQLFLLGETLSSNTLRSSNQLLAALKHALKPSGDLLIYGCQVGQGAQGAEFVSALAQLTQTDVAASIDNTGGVQQGGNWILERQFGKINTAHLFNSNALLLADYPTVLGQQVVKYGNISSAIVDDVTMTVNISPTVDLTIDWGTGTQGSNVYTNSRVQQLTALGGAVGPVDVDDTFYNNRSGGLQLTATGNFSLDAFELFRRGAANGNTEDFTLIGFDNGSQVVSDTLTWVITGSFAAETFTRGSGTWAANPAWQSVDKVVIVWPTEVAGNTTGIQGTAGYQEIAISSVTISDFVAATNTAPALDLNGVGAGNDHTISFSTSTVSIAPDATVTDGDGDTMSTITVTMASRPDGSAEGLNVTAAAKNALGGISGQSDSVLQNTISITGASATTAQVATFLQSITYNNTAGSPDLSARSATVVINDGTDDSLTRTVTINVTGDITPPSGHSVALNQTSYNATQASSLSFQFASGEIGANYSYSLTSTGGGSAITGTGTLATAVDTVSSLNVTGLNNGTLTLSVVVTDAAGNAATAVTDTATLDKISPTVVTTTSDNALKMGETPTLTFTLSEASSNFSSGDVVVTGGALSNFSGSGSLYTATFTPTTNSTTAATINVAADTFTDLAGNNNTVAAQLNMTVDTLRPSVTLSSNKTQLKVAETATITATLSEASSDFAVSDIAIIGGTLSGFTGSGTSYTATFTPTTNSTTAATINVAADTFTDLAGNTNTSATQLNMTVDTQRPSVTLSSNKTQLKLAETATITATLSEASSDFTVSDISITGGTLSGFTGSGTSYTATFTPTANSTTAATINVAADTFTDLAGNNNTVAAQLNMTVDTLRPSVTLSSNKTQLKVAETATITATLSEASGDFTVGDVVVAGGSLSSFSGSGSLYTATFTPTTNSTSAATINVAADTFTDAAGNNNTVATQLNIAVDTLRPSVTLSSNKTQLKVAETATITATLSEASSDFTVSDISITGGTLSGFTGSGTSYTATFTPTTSSTTAATINVAADTFTDLAGNNNTVATQLNMTVDTLRPSVTLSSNKTQLKVAETATITATLSEASSDFTVSDIAIIGGSLSGFTGSGTSYTVTFTPTTNSTSAATINVAADTFTDAAGNNNTVATQLNIAVDTLRPSVTLSSNKTQLKVGETATITATLSEASGDFTVGDVVVAGGSLSSFSGSGSLYTATFTPTTNSTTAATINVAADTFTDAAGNNNTVATQLNIAVDTQLPSVTLSSNKTQLKVGETATITATLSEASGDFTVGDIVVAGGSLSSFSGSGSLYTATFTPTTNSTSAATINVAADTFTDAAGNNNTVATQLNIAVDTLRPSVTLSSNKTQLKVGETATITATLSEASSDFTLGDISITGGTLSGLSGSGTSYTVTLTPTVEGQINVSVAADTFSNASGNLNVASTTQHIQYDGTSPYITALLPADNSANVAKDASLAITFNETIVAGSGNISIFDSADDSLLEAIAVGGSKIIMTGQVVTIDPTATFTPTHSYYVLIGNNALEDSAGNTFSGFSTQNSYNFTINNLVPHVSDDTVSIAEDNQVAIAVLENDSDDDSPINLASMTINSQPLHGITRVNTGTGVVNYTPDPNYVGSDSFTYTVEDIYGGESIPATVTLTVAPVADDPVALNDVAETTEDTLLPIDVVANDTDPDIGDILNTTQIVVTPPKHGSAMVADGKVNYTPSLDFTGTDHFSYTVADSTGRVSNLATVTINVSGANEAPIGVADSVTTDEDHDIDINVLVNDTDSDGTIDVASVQIVKPPAHGSVSANASGVLTFTPEANYSGGDNFTYVVEDDLHASSAETTVTVTINSLNDAPVARDDIAMLQADIPHRINVLGNDSDIDGTLNLSSISIVATPTQGLATVIASGLIQYTPNTHLSGEDSFTYTIADNSGAISNVATVTLTNNVVNHLPIANNDEASTEEDQPVSLNVTSNDSDVDGSLETTSLMIVTTPSLGSVTVNGDGSITYIPQANASGLDSFMYTISDNEGGRSNQATIHITIRAVNDAPSISIDSTISTDEDNDQNLSFTYTDVDDNTVVASVSTQASHGTASVNGTSVNYIPEANFFGSDSFTLTLTDNAGYTTTQQINVTVSSVNDVPSINIGSTLSTDEDNNQSLSFSYSDVDGDTVVASVSTQASHGTASVNGTTVSYAPVANYFGSDSFTLTLTDNNGYSTSQQINVTVASVNDAPSISMGSTLSTDEDNSQSLSFTYSDLDGDTVVASVSSLASHGTVSVNGTSVSYAPEADFFGNDSFVLTLTDNNGYQTTKTITVNVNGLNDKPIAEDDLPILQTNDENRYQIDVLANDSDADGDPISIIAASVSVGEVRIKDNQLVYQAPIGTAGKVEFNYMIQDPTGASASAQVSLLLQAIANERLPTLSPPEDVVANATGLFTKLDIGKASAVDAAGEALPVSLVNGPSLFPPGNNTVHWQASDAQGNTVILSQNIKVNPLISIAKDQQVVEGTEQQVTVYLNGKAPDYPVRIAYSVSGTADENDHDLSDGELIIEQGTEGVIPLFIYQDSQTEGNETIEIHLSREHNLGNKSVHTLTIVENNVAPEMELQVSQAGEQRHLVLNNQDLVLIKALISDANPADNHTIVWASKHSEMINLATEQDQFIFNPTSLVPGIYPLTATVSDDAPEALSSKQNIYIEVTNALAELGNEDSDNDLISDAQEGYKDSDNDGVPDYLDAIDECNVLQEQVLHGHQFLVEAEPGVCLHKGVTIAGNQTGGAQLLEHELLANDEMTNVGGIFDFIATGLATPGQNYTVVLPQRLPIPESAVYRKFQNGQWVNFVEDTNNIVSSAAGEQGYCPPPNDPQWAAGLNAGYWCVQLTIQDGGPNDDDGLVNASITDPGGVAINLSNNQFPVAMPDSVTVKWNESIVIDVLANDTDPDNDTLNITAATVDFGELSIENSQLVYTTSDSFFDKATIQYNITDNHGGSAYSSVVIQVVNNFAPIAHQDSATTDDHSQIKISVLSNDLDADNDQLTLTQASANYGDVVINDDQTLTYTPKLGFDGEDMITYSIQDEKSASAQGTVMVTVKAYVSTTVENSSGGSMGVTMLLFAGLLLLRRHKQIGSMLLLLIISAQAQAEPNRWSVETELGYAKAHHNSELDNIPSVQVMDTDDSDFAWSIGIAYRFKPKWKLALRYIDLGQGSATLKAETLSPEEYHQAVAKATPVLGHGFASDLSYQLLNNEHILVDGSLGLFRWKSQLESIVQDSVIQHDKTATDPYLGLQAAYQLSPQWALGLGYAHYFISENDIDAFSIKLIYRL